MIKPFLLFLLHQLFTLPVKSSEVCLLLLLPLFDIWEGEIWRERGLERLTDRLTDGCYVWYWPNLSVGARLLFGMPNRLARKYVATRSVRSYNLYRPSHPLSLLSLKSPRLQLIAYVHSSIPSHLPLSPHNSEQYQSRPKGPGGTLISKSLWPVTHMSKL